MLLVEKFRPKTFAEIVGCPSEIEQYMKQEVKPPFLFSGPPGTGKTSTARVIAKSLGSDFMYLNASDETGIDTIRNKVSKFAMGMTMETMRVILLDEVDGLTFQAQQALRGIIDKYQNNCLFILTCNYDYKIIDPLKSSRAIHIKFEKPPRENIIGRIKWICEQENIKITPGAIDKLVDLNYPDIRSCIMQLERLTIKYKDKMIMVELVDTNELNASTIVSLLKAKKLAEASQMVDEKYSDMEALINDLCDEFWLGDYPLEKKQALVVNILRRAYVELTRVKNYKPIVRPMLYEIMQAL